MHELGWLPTLYVSFSLPIQLIIAVAGVLTGYNGSFEFKEPGQEYGEYPYVGMRVVSYISIIICFHNCNVHKLITSLSLSPLYSLYTHPLPSHNVTLGMCDYGSFGSSVSISYSLGVGPFQHCIIVSWCINDLWDRYPHSLSVHSSRPSTTLLCHAINVLYCQIHQLQKRVGLLVHMLIC